MITVTGALPCSGPHNMCQLEELLSKLGPALRGKSENFCTVYSWMLH